MNITVTCPEHPRYKGVFPPRSTVRHIAGCECCWWLFHNRASDTVMVVAPRRFGYPVMKVVRK